MTKPRLLIATDNFLPRRDGIARFLEEIIPRMVEKYEVTIISPDYGITSLDLKIRRVLIPLRKKQYGDYTPAQWKPEIVKSAVEEADIVFSQTIGPVGYLVIKYAKRLKKPIVSYIHSIEWELVPKALKKSFFKRIAYPLIKFLTRHIYNKCNLLILPSENIADRFTWQRIKTKKKIVHLGVDTKKFVKGDKKAVRRVLKIPQKRFVIGFHGRIGYEKNLLTLSRAYLRLKEKDKQLLIVGDGVPELKRRLNRLKGVTITGSKEDVVPYLQAMDVYVMPSFTETTSLSVLEAMSCSLPVISSPVGFIQQYITHGENGLFFETKNAFELSGKIHQLAEDPSLRERLGRDARKTVVERFNWNSTAEGILKALQSVAK